MNKPFNRSLIVIIISALMILSALAMLTPGAFAVSSGTVTYNPTTFGINEATGAPVTTVAFVSGGTFSSGATIYFYLSREVS